MAAAKSNRSRKDYEFSATEFSEVTDVKQLVKQLAAWMRDMRAWGELVRDDIIRMESALGLAPGDPGDPPPAPRRT